jgi:sugar phosphate permease
MRSMPATTSPPKGVSVQKPTRIRHYVLCLTFFTSFIMYVDRVCMGSATPYIMADFHLTKVQMGAATSAFNWAYALFQVPGGWMADRFGPRLVLAAAMGWWSIFTIGTGFSFSVTSLAITQWFFGMGEAAAFPSSSRALLRWLPKARRAFGQGFQHAGSRLGAAVTPPFVAFMIRHWGWHWVFYVLGMIGIPWAIGWYLYYRNHPNEHRGVNEAELEILDTSRDAKPKAKPVVPWGIILRSRNLWFLSSMYFCYGWMLWMYLQWFPTYLIEARHVSLRSVAWAASSPLLTATFTNVLGGWGSDRLAHRLGDLRRGRLFISVLGFLIAGTAVVAGVLADSLPMAIFCLSLAMGGLELTVAVSWAMSLDIGGEYSGSVSAVMNMLGNIGGALAAFTIGYLATHYGWTPALLVASPMCLTAAILATQIDPRRSVVQV